MNKFRFALNDLINFQINICFLLNKLIFWKFFLCLLIQLRQIILFILDIMLKLTFAPFWYLILNIIFSIFIIYNFGLIQGWIIDIYFWLFNIFILNLFSNIIMYQRIIFYWKFKITFDLFGWVNLLMHLRVDSKCLNRFLGFFYLFKTLIVRFGP